MSFVKQLVGGYYTFWLMGLGSSIVMLLVSFIISIFTNDATILQMVYFLYNASVSIFIVITLVPVGIFLLVAVPVWNAINDFVAPILGAFLDPVLGALARIIGGSYTPIATVGVRDQNLYSIMLSYGQFLKGLSDFLFTEVVG